MLDIEPETPEEIAAYEERVQQEARENVENEKNGRFIFWFVLTLFSGAAIAAFLAS